MLKSKINETDFKKISPVGAAKIWQAVQEAFQETLQGWENSC